MNSDFKQTPPPPDAPVSRSWSAYRRPVFLVSLVIGLVLALIWLPEGALLALLTALVAQRALVGMSFFFALIALSLLWSAGQRLDARIFLFFNLLGYHPRWLDRLMWLLTQFGSLLTAFLLAGLFFILHDRRFTSEVILGTLTLWVLVETIKALTDRARPFLTLEETRVIGWRERGRSFPSGHTAQAFFVATLLIHHFQLGMWEIIALYALATLVGFTRIYVGVHYPRDVIGGAVLGSIWGILGMLVDPFWTWLRF